jgi:hypothetical protein
MLIIPALLSIYKYDLGRKATSFRRRGGGNKNDTFTTEGVIAGRYHYIPTPARRTSYFSQKPANSQAVPTAFAHIPVNFHIDILRLQRV